VLRVDPNLVSVGDVFKIAEGSPAIDAADASVFPFVADDIDGKPRMLPDIAADELVDAPIKYGILTPADVGPMAP
jgi:poly(beta-D-mannuronate) lyase